MFRIGEFSQIARVSVRLLRWYDTLGLLRPQRIDPQTGYRYYSAGQLGQLNRILALKDLGLSLDQVGKLIDDRISAEDIRGMLTLKKAELERSLDEEAARLRHIESRLKQIEEEGALSDYDVVVKSAAAQAYLGLRATYPQMAAVVATLRDVTRTVAARVPASVRGQLIVVAHSDFQEDGLDLEIGVGVTRAINKPVTLADGRALGLSELPAVDSLATLVREGPLEQAHLAYGALGLWMESQGYEIAGPCREVFLEMPFQRPDGDAAMEIQFPVSRVT